MKVTFDDIQTRESQHVLQTTGVSRWRLCAARARVSMTSMAASSLDFVSGIGVASLGHAHPGLAAVIAEQASTLLHTSNLYFHPFQAEAAGRLSALSGLPRVFFCNSGTEANEACLKFARRYWHTQGAKDRVGFVAVEQGFAGRTMGALSVTYDEHYRAPFGPLIGPVTFVNPDSPDALAAAVNDRTAAIIAEPIRGEGGALPRAFSDAIMDVCRRTGTLLIADEVQTGLGRTGYPFYSQALGWQPDLISVGKALGSGVPVGAALVSERVAGAISAGDHGTLGGNLLATRAAAFFLEQLMDHGLIEHVKTVGAHSSDGYGCTLALKHPVIRDVRGAGLMRGVDLRIDAAPVIDQARQRGLLVNRTSETVVRLLPPLTIEAADIDAGIDLLDAVLMAVATEVPA